MSYTGHENTCVQIKKSTLEFQRPYHGEFESDDTGKVRSKQLIIACITTEVIEYHTPEFRDLKTGQRVHAAFPGGVVDDVNYDGTVKALAYMLNNECNVSIGKTRRFLSENSHGKIDISNGMICNLSRQFSRKTQGKEMNCSRN